MPSFLRKTLGIGISFILVAGLTWTCLGISGGSERYVTACLSGENIWDIILNDYVVLRMRCPNGGMSPEERAICVAERLERAIATANCEDIKPAVEEGSLGVVIGTDHIATADVRHAEINGSTCYELALEWANNLRLALGGFSLPKGDTNHLVSFDSVSSHGVYVGQASWYGGYWNGRLTANGEIYDEMSLTAAHRTLPFESIVRVTNLSCGKQVVVRINNRGPYIDGRVIDLSKAAAKAIDLISPGITDVAIEVIAEGS